MAATDNFMKVANATLTSLDSPGKPIGAASLNLVSATNWPTDTGVILAMRKVDASLITDVNPAGVVPNSYTEWAGQLSGVTVSNLTLAYGTDQDYSEGLGTQIYIPLSGAWANRLVAALLLQHKQDGSHDDITAESIAVAGNATVAGNNQDKGVNLETIRVENMADHIASGCVVSATSGQGWALSAGVVYIGGKRLIVASTSGNVGASKDSYFDLHDNGDGTAVLVNTGGNVVNNGAASPALASNSIRISKVISDASAVTSIVKTGVDTLGNLVSPLSMIPLLSQIFGNSVQRYTPTVSDTSSIIVSSPIGWYINLGGIKITWGQVAYSYIGGNSQGHSAVSLPPDFFTDIHTYLPSIMSEGNYAFQTVSGDSIQGSLPNAKAAFYVNNGGAAGAGTVSWLIIGS